MPTIKRNNLRRCSQCQAVGHNKARCSNLARPLTTAQNKPTTQSVNLFVHHVTHHPPSSPHVINLKTDESHLWKKTTPAAPENNLGLYHSYHTAPRSYNSTPATRTIIPDAPSHETNKKFGAPALAKLFHPILNKVKDAAGASAPPWLEKKPKLINSLKQQTARTLSGWTLWLKEQKKFAGRAVALSLIIVITLGLLPGPAKSYYGDLKNTADRITTESLSGLEALNASLSALKAFDIKKASELSSESLEHLTFAVGELQTKHRVAQTIVELIPGVGKDFIHQQKLLLAAEAIALANTKILVSIEKNKLNTTASGTLPWPSLTTILPEVLPLYSAALKNIESVSPEAIPPSYRSALNTVKELLAGLNQDSAKLTAAAPTLTDFLGHQGRRRYLVVFQNPDELRPTGGFMGSLAILEMRNGKIVSLVVPPGGPYDLQGQLDVWAEPPTPLLLANKRWEFQDANWFPDFPTSAEKMLWFYRHSRGITLDGVIAINSPLLPDILSVLGPLHLENRQLALTAENALSTIQTVVEFGAEKKSNRPKQIIADALPKLLETLKTASSSAALSVAQRFHQGLESKDIQIYLADPALQKSIETLGWSGAVASTNLNQDYLLVVNTNIQGAKSDAAIHQSIHHEALIEDDGSIINTVTIDRAHTGNASDPLYGQTNIDYLRIYVPKGSALISAAGFSWPDEKVFRTPFAWSEPDDLLKSIEREIGVDSRSGTRITEEFGKYAFGNWIITEPGAKSQIQFTYRLPFKARRPNSSGRLALWDKLLLAAEPLSAYQLAVQRQSGAVSTFSSQIIFPENWRVHWAEGKNITPAQNGLRIETMNLSSDEVWSVLVKQ